MTPDRRPRCPDKPVGTAEVWSVDRAVTQAMYGAVHRDAALAVSGAVSGAVYGSVYRAVYRPVNGVVYRDVLGAVNEAISGVVREEVRRDP